MLRNRRVDHDRTSLPITLETGHRERQARRKIPGEGDSDCRRIRSYESLRDPQKTTARRTRRTTHSIKTVKNARLSTNFNNLPNLVRDQEFGITVSLSPIHAKILEQAGGSFLFALVYGLPYISCHLVPLVAVFLA